MLRCTFDPRQPHRYVRYGRMSTDQQNERSPDQQFDTIAHLLGRLGHPWVHVGDYRDDGISGRYLRKRRPDIRVMHLIDALWASYSGNMPELAHSK